MRLYVFGVMSALLLCSALQASLAGIHDESGVNKFLGSTISSCSHSAPGCNTGDVTTSSMYVDQRQTLDGFLGLNFAQHKDRVFYFFNEFGYWSALREQYGNDLDSAGVYAGQDDQVQAKVASKYPGEGVYIIAISAEPGFVSRVGKNVPCQAGQIKVAAILFYDNGEGFQPLSASCIALNPTDAFNLYISSNNSGAVKLPHGVTAFSGRLTNSPSGSVNFQASEITVTIPKQSTQKLSVKSSKKGSVSSTRSEQASSSTSSSLSNDIVPTISLGNPLNLGASPQSISLRKS